MDNLFFPKTLWVVICDLVLDGANVKVISTSIRVMERREEELRFRGVEGKLVPSPRA